MTDTGHFKILETAGKFDRTGKLVTICTLKVLCNHCAHVTCRSYGEIEAVNGGVVVTCRSCGVRQAVSNANICHMATNDDDNGLHPPNVASVESSNVRQH